MQLRAERGGRGETDAEVQESWCEAAGGGRGGMKGCLVAAVSSD